MAEYSGRDAEYAAHIVERLLGRESEGLELEPDLAVSDVESDADAGWCVGNPAKAVKAPKADPDPTLPRPL